MEARTPARRALAVLDTPPMPEAANPGQADFRQGAQRHRCHDHR